jgi:hypothetical protein
MILVISLQVNRVIKLASYLKLIPVRENNGILYLVSSVRIEYFYNYIINRYKSPLSTLLAATIYHGRFFVSL